MQFFNVDLKGLNGRPHPVLSGIFTTKDVQKSRSHVKLLCDDLYTYEKRAKYDGGSPNCRLCFKEEQQENIIENVTHIISICEAYTDIRERIKNEIKSVSLNILPETSIHDILGNPAMFTQFIVDCTSHNLPVRIIPSSEIFTKIMNLSRDLCYGILKKRSEKLNELMIK